MAYDREYHRAYYAAHKEEIKARVRARYWSDPETGRAESRAYHQKHRADCNAKSKQRYFANRAARLAQQKIYNQSRAEALKTYKQAWAAKNRERIVAQKAAKYRERREEISAKRKELYRLSPDEAKRRARAYHESNKERRRWGRMTDAERCNAAARERGATWRLENAERHKAKNDAWRRANPDKARDAVTRRRARERNARVGQVNYRWLRKLFNGVCPLCSQVLDLVRDEYHYDHIVPLSAGGAHVTENLQITHALCNLKKGARAA